MKDRVVPRRKEIVLCTEVASIKHVNSSLYHVTELQRDINKPLIHKYIFSHLLESIYVKNMDIWYRLKFPSLDHSAVV